MTDAELSQEINRQEGHVEYSSKRSTVSIDRRDGKSYFFQGEEADNLIAEADALWDRLGNVSIQKCFLWLSSGWG